MNRRHFMTALAGLAASTLARSQRGSEGDGILRIGLTPVFLDNQTAFLARWRNYLESRLGREVAFVQRGTYREVVDELRSGAIDFGWICGYPYVRHASELRLLAIPTYQGEPLYQSYLIVPASDTTTTGILDLRGRVFAYSDPDSNSGFLYPNYLLTTLQERPGAFFRRSFFTWAHRSVVEAVGVELANAGAVDGYVWDTLQKLKPEVTGRTRIVSRSPKFGFPPLAARVDIPESVFRQIQDVLLGMRDDETGRALLGELNLDGFVPGNETVFDSIRQMASVVRGGGNVGPA